VPNGQHKQYLESWAETTPQKLDHLSPEQLQTYHDFFCTAQTWFFDNAFRAKECGERIELLRHEIGRRQHREVHGTARKTLRWAIVGGVTGILILFAEYYPLIRDTFFSKAPHASAPQSTPSSLRQSQPPTSVSPGPEANSSISTPSPQSAATTTPLLSTPEP
jgi:hypothetical protein